MEYSAFGVEHEVSKGLSLRQAYAGGRGVGAYKAAANSAGAHATGREVAGQMRAEMHEAGGNRVAVHVGEHAPKYAAGAGAAGGATAMHLRDKRKNKKK